MKITFRTRNGQSPLGLQNIFVSSLPGDEEFRDSVIDRIFADSIGSCCAVWYDTEPGEEYDKETLYGVLLDMQMIVLCATNSMLKVSSRALEREMKFGIGHQIPVIGVLRKGADTAEAEFKFRGSCGFLREESDNFTAELAGTLRSYIGDEELHNYVAENISNGRIYLCGEQTDGANIRRMTDTLANIEFCRDFSVVRDNPSGLYSPDWETTRALIDGSDLTILIISDKVMESGAHISAAYEYLQNTGRPYLAVLMSQIKYSRLLSMFNETASFVDGLDEQAVREAVGDHIGFKAVGRDTRQHRYFVGMAYLYGIRVVCSRAFGISMLESAAREGFFEAEKQLAFMYANGFAVEKDPQTGANWLNKAINSMTRVYNSHPTMENAVLLVEMINSFGSIFLQAEEFDRAEAAYSNSTKLCERRLTSEVSGELLKLYADACSAIGRVRMSKRNLKAAEESFRKALESYDVILSSDAENDVMRSAAEIYAMMGELCLTRGDLSGADSNYRRAYEMRDYIAVEFDTVQARRELAKCLEHYSGVYERREQLSRARDCLCQACDICSRIAEETGTIQARRDYATALSALYFVSRDEPNAERLMLEAVDIRRELMTVLDSSEIARELYADYELLSELEKGRGNLDAAKKYLMQGLDFRKALSEKHPDNHDLMENVAWNCWNIAALVPGAGDNPKFYLEAAGIWDKLFKRTGQSAYREHALSARSKADESISSVE